MPAEKESGPCAANGELLFIKGQDSFRYKVSESFRDSGKVSSVQTGQQPAATVEPQSVVTLSVPITVQLDPNQARQELVHQVPPQYPDSARAAGLEGTVSLLVKISTDGSVTEVQEISGPRGLVRAAIAAVKQWRYRPILANGKAQQATTTVQIHFKLSQ